MTLKKITYLYCDGVFCRGVEEPFDHAPPPHQNGKEQRARARREGWVHRNGKDYCEECKYDDE